MNRRLGQAARTVRLLAVTVFLCGCVRAGLAGAAESEAVSTETGMGQTEVRLDFGETAVSRVITAPSALDTLPLSYDGRKYNRTARVKDQGALGTCWAFAALSALESRLLPGETWDFSEDHMSHYPGFTLAENEGGEYTMAMAYLLSWNGPVRESDDPYGDGVSPENLAAVKHVQEVRLLSSSDTEAIKRAVYEYGSVEGAMYIDMQYGSEWSEYYNAETFAYCCTEKRAPDHDVVIVGWDDSFPREAFLKQPSADGAFLCQNSWGTAFGDSGFFYVSYEDCNIREENIVYTGVEDTNHYTKIYQSDRCGWVGQLGYGNETAWGANVYTADEDTELSAAGFYAIGPDSDYEVYLLRNVPEHPTDGELTAARVKKASGHLQYAGYYTIPFDEAVRIPAGERFAVMIRMKTPGAVHPIAIEYDTGDGKCRVSLADGEGYASKNGSVWEHVEEQQKCNLCLKAYGTSAEQ